MAAPDEEGEVESSLTQERRYKGEGGESVVGGLDALFHGAT